MLLLVTSGVFVAVAEITKFPDDREYRFVDISKGTRGPISDVSLRDFMPSGGVDPRFLTGTKQGMGNTDFDLEFTHAAGSGRVDALTQTVLAAYRSNSAEREMRSLSAKQALQSLEAERGILYTKEVRADALRRYCDYFAASLAYSAFSHMDDKRIMRKALDATLAQ